MTQAPKRLKDSGGAFAAALTDYVDAPLPPLSAQVVRSARRASPKPFFFVAIPLAVGAALVVLLAFRATPPATVLFASADAQLRDGAGALDRTSWNTAHFDSLSSGSGLALVAQGDHRLVLLAAGTVEQAGTDRLRLRNGTLGVATKSAIVVEAGDRVVRLSKGSAEIASSPFSVRALDGEVALELPGEVVRLEANQAWPSGASASLTRPFLAATSSAVHVEANGPVSIDEVLVGAPPLDVPLAPGVHLARSNGVSVSFETPSTTTLVIPSADRLLDEARATSDLDEALRLLARLASSPNAELALYERARRQLEAGRLDGALTDLITLRDRFPVGALAAEASLSRVEVLIALGRDEALTEASAFLDRFPDSERRAEVLILRAELARRANQPAAATVDLEAAATDPRWADEAHWRQCFVAANQDRAVATYLRLHPSGAHAAEARAALGANR